MLAGLVATWNGATCSFHLKWCPSPFSHSVPMIHCVAFAAQYGGLLPTFSI